MEKLILSADSDGMLYEVDNIILENFNKLLDDFFEWKHTNNYDEQLFVKFLKIKYGEDSIRFLKNIGYISNKLPLEYRNIKWFNF